MLKSPLSVPAVRISRRLAITGTVLWALAGAISIWIGLGLHNESVRLEGAPPNSDSVRLLVPASFHASGGKVGNISIIGAITRIGAETWRLSADSASIGGVPENWQPWDFSALRKRGIRPSCAAWDVYGHRVRGISWTSISRPAMTFVPSWPGDPGAPPADDSIMIEQQRYGHRPPSLEVICTQSAQFFWESSFKSFSVSWTRSVRRVDVAVVFNLDSVTLRFDRSIDLVGSTVRDSHVVQPSCSFVADGPDYPALVFRADRYAIINRSTGYPDRSHLPFGAVTYGRTRLTCVRPSPGQTDSSYFMVSADSAMLVANLSDVSGFELTGVSGFLSVGSQRIAIAGGDRVEIRHGCSHVSIGGGTSGGIVAVSCAPGVQWFVNNAPMLRAKWRTIPDVLLKVIASAYLSALTWLAFQTQRSGQRGRPRQFGVPRWPRRRTPPPDFRR